MALSFDLRQITPGTTTGNGTVTGLGFQPKALIAYGNNGTADGSYANAVYSYGFAVGSSSQACISGISVNGAGTSDSERLHTNTKFYSLINSGGTTVNDISLNSFDADGFTYNQTTTNGTSKIVNIISLGGADLTNAAITEFTLGTVTGNGTVTGVGFQPDFIFLIGASGTAALPSASAAAFNILGFGKSSSSRASLTTRIGDGLTTQSNYKYQVSDKFYTSVNAGTIQAEADLVSMNADGFVYNVIVAGGARKISALCLKGGQYAMGTFAQGTVTGDQAITGVGFQPKGLIIASNNMIQGTAILADARESFGASMGTSKTVSIYNGDRDGVPGTSSSSSNLDSTALFRHMSAGGASPATQTYTTFKSFGADGFTITNGTVDSSARTVIYWAMGNAAVPPVPPVGVSNFGDEPFIS